MRNENKKAFTLVELLVVISIIALLLAILMPSLQKAREQAKRTICASNLHNLSLAFCAYDTTYEELPPGNCLESTLMQSDIHILLSRNYGMSQGAVICPSADIIDDGHYNWEWGNPDSPWALTTYCYIGGYGNAPTESISQKDGWYTEYFWARENGYFPSQSMAKQRKPSGMPLMQDIATWNEDGLYVGVGRSNHVSGKYTGIFKGSTYVRGKKVGQNLLYYDGHVEWQWMVPSQSWQYGRDYYLGYYLTSPGCPGRPPSPYCIWR